MVKGKDIPVRGHGGPQGCERLRLPHNSYNKSALNTCRIGIIYVFWLQKKCLTELSNKYHDGQPSSPDLRCNCSTKKVTEAEIA
jgi:hypothetical protein